MHSTSKCEFRSDHVRHGKRTRVSPWSELQASSTSRTTKLVAMTYALRSMGTAPRIRIAPAIHATKSRG